MAGKAVEVAELIIKTTDGNSFAIMGKKIDKTTKKLQENEKATKNADRATKGLTQQSANSTKNFSKMATMQGGLVSVYATIAAQVFALSAAFMFLKEAFETRNLVEGQLAFGAATGVAYATLTAQIQEASGGMIQFKEAAQAAAIGTAAGLSGSQLERLGAAAKNTSLALGRDMTDAFQRLVRGTTKAEPELLDELGIILRLEPALKKYAISIGKSVDDLNQFEKSQAIANEVLDQAESKFSAIEETMDPAGFALQKFLKAFDDLMKGVKTGVTNFLIPVISFFSNNILALIGSLTLFLVPILRSILPDFAKMAAAANDKAAQHKAAIEVEKAALESYKQKLEEVRKAKNKEHTLAGQKRDKLASDMGISSTTTGQLNAVKHYERQTVQILEGSIKERTGMLKKFNAGQVNDLKLANQRMAKSSTDFSLKVQVAFQGISKRFAILTSTMKMKWASTMAFMVKGAKFMAKGVNMAMKLMGALGIILMLIDAIKMLWNWLFPPDEAKQAQQEMVDGMVDKYAKLNEETEKMIETQEKGVLTFSGSIEQIGNAFKSVDIAAVIKDYNELVAADKVDTKEGKSMIANVLKNLDALQSTAKGTKALASLKKLMESGEGITEADLTRDSKKGIEGFQGYTEAMENAATASQMLSEKQKTLAASIRGAMGTVKENKFIGIERNLNDVIATQEAKRGEGGIASEAALGSMKKGVNKAASAYADSSTAATNYKGKGMKFWQNEDVIRKNLEYQAKKDLEHLESQREKYAEGKKAAEQLDKEIERNKNLGTWLKTLREAESKRIEDLNAAKLEGAKIDTVAMDAKTKNERLDNKVALNMDKQKKALGALNAATLIYTTATQEEMADPLWKKQAQDNIKQAATAYNIEIEKHKRLKESTSWQQALNVAKERDLKSTFEIAKLTHQNARVTKQLAMDAAAAVTHTDRYNSTLKQIGDKGSKVVTQTMKRDRLQTKIDNLNKEDVKNATLILALERQRDLIDESILTTQQAITHEYQKQYNILNAIAQQQQNADATLAFENMYGERGQGGLSILKGAAGSINPNAKAQREALTKAGVTSFKGLEDKYKTTKATEAAGGADAYAKYTPEQKLEAEAKFAVEAERAATATRQAANASAQIAIETELANSVASTLKQGFVDMFQALIDGSQSFGDAMKGIMSQVLMDLAAAYLQAAALKALSSMGFGLPARYGGVLSPSGKSFSGGGIGTGPESGYLATLHGTEAVVPLGNDRSIPVEMRGQPGGNTVNVTVNMAEGGQSSTTATGDSQMQGMGRAIGSLVQQHLQQEMRPGGLLNQQGTKGRGG